MSHSRWHLQWNRYPLDNSQDLFVHQHRIGWQDRWCIPDLLPRSRCPQHRWWGPHWQRSTRSPQDIVHRRFGHGEVVLRSRDSWDTQCCGLYRCWQFQDCRQCGVLPRSWEQAGEVAHEDTGTTAWMPQQGSRAHKEQRDCFHASLAKSDHHPRRRNLQVACRTRFARFRTVVPILSIIAVSIRRALRQGLGRDTH